MIELGVDDGDISPRTPIVTPGKLIVTLGMLIVTLGMLKVTLGSVINVTDRLICLLG